MSVKQIVEKFFVDLWGSAEAAGSLEAIRPELVLCATLLALLVVRMVVPRWRSSAYYVSLAGLVGAMGLVLWAGLPRSGQSIFTGMLVMDGLSCYFRGLILLGALVVVSLTGITRVPSDESSLEFYFLLVGAVLGMCVMVSANHLLMVVIGLEMASICSYVLAGILRDRRQAMEAALKFAVFGAATAGVMLYGMSLLAGSLGSVHLPTLSCRLAERMPSLAQPEASSVHGPVLLLGGVMFLVGLAFKLSAFPFHFWAPDVMEGAPAEVGGFLSVVSKTAALGLLARLALVICGPDELEPVRHTMAGLLILVAAVTCTFGNLAAYGQSNMKRLMAYSTIAHAGYLMMPVPAMLILAGQDGEAARTALAALLFYATVYLWMNLGVFGFVAFLRDRIGREEILAYQGLGRRNPGVVVGIGIHLFSLVGIPPLAGFMAKFTVFASLYQAGLWTLLLIAVLNTVLSLFYYLRVIRVMVASPAEGSSSDGSQANPSGKPSASGSSNGWNGGSATDHRNPFPPQGEEGPSSGPPTPKENSITLPIVSWPGLWLLVTCVPIVVLGIWWNELFALAQAAVARCL